MSHKIRLDELFQRSPVLAVRWAYTDLGRFLGSNDPAAKDISEWIRSLKDQRCQGGFILNGMFFSSADDAEIYLMNNGWTEAEAAQYVGLIKKV